MIFRNSGVSSELFGSIYFFISFYLVVKHRLTFVTKTFSIRLKNGLHTLESLIDVGQGISIGPGRFGKKNKRRALNKHRAWKIWKKE